MLRLLLFLRMLIRFPRLDLLVMGLAIVYAIFKPFGAYEKRLMLTEGVRTVAEVERLTETVFGTFVEISFLTKNGEKVGQTINELDISSYGLTMVLPQTVEVTYLADDPKFVWLGNVEGSLETFWTDFFTDRWMDILFIFALWMLMLRIIIYSMRKGLESELQNS